MAKDFRDITKERDEWKHSKRKTKAKLTLDGEG